MEIKIKKLEARPCVGAIERAASRPDTSAPEGGPPAGLGSAATKHTYAHAHTHTEREREINLQGLLLGEGGGKKALRA